jgi:hypothetical protein
MLRKTVGKVKAEAKEKVKKHGPKFGVHEALCFRATIEYLAGNGPSDDYVQ